MLEEQKEDLWALIKVSKGQVLGDEGGEIGKNLNMQGLIGRSEEFGYYYHTVDSHWSIYSRRVT